MALIDVQIGAKPKCNSGCNVHEMCQMRGMVVGWMHIYERACVCGHAAFCT